MPSALELSLRHMGIALLIPANSRIASGELVHLVDTITGPLWPMYTLPAYQGEKPVHVTRFHQLVCRFFSSL